MSTSHLALAVLVLLAAAGAIAAAVAGTVTYARACRTSEYEEEVHPRP